MLAVIGASAMLNCTGRRTLMLLWTLMCAIFLIVQGIAAIKTLRGLEIVMTMLFVSSFEFGPGPIVWLYNGEILNDKAISVAVSLNWFFTILVGLFSNTIINAIEIGPTFFLFAAFNLVSVVFIFFFMKETKGLTDA